MKIPIALQEALDKRRAKRTELAEVRAQNAQAKKDYEYASAVASKHLADLGEAEVNHLRAGASKPDALRKKVAANQLAMVMFTARVNGFHDLEHKLTAEIAANKQPLAEAINTFRSGEKSANTRDLELLVAEFVSRARTIVAKARGIGNDRVLHSVSEARFPIGGKDAFRALHRWSEDAEMKSIATEWTNVLSTIDRELRED